MPVPKRPRDGHQLAMLVADMATGEAPNDKDEILSPESEPAGWASSAKARAASQTPERGSSEGCRGALGRSNTVKNAER